MKITVTTDRDIYRIGEKMVITVSVCNVGATPVKYPPLNGWPPSWADRLDSLQIRYFGPGFFEGSPRVDGYRREGYAYASGSRQSFSEKPEQLDPGQERSVTFEKVTVALGLFRIEANFHIANKCYLRIVVPPDARDSRDIFASPRQTVEIPDGWTGLIRGTKTVTVDKTVEAGRAEYIERCSSDLTHDSAHARHLTMDSLADFSYAGKLHLLAALDDKDVVRTGKDRRVLVKALADSLHKYYARDVLERLFRISMDDDEDVDVRLEALQAYRLITPRHLRRDGFILRPEQDMVNLWAANLSRLRTSAIEKIREEARDIRNWSEDKTTIDP